MTRMDYIRRKFGISEKVGMLILVGGRVAEIIGAKGEYLRIRYDGSQGAVLAHPTDERIQWGLAAATHPGTLVDILSELAYAQDRQASVQIGGWPCHSSPRRTR